MEKQFSSKNFVDENGNVYILGDFDKTISTEVVPKLVDVIDKLSSTRNPIINVYINSYGGYCHELYALLTLLAKAKAQGISIVTIVLGVAMSCGSLLAVFGDHRVMWKYGTHLMHYGQTFLNPTTPLQLERESKNAKIHFDNLVKLYSENTKLSVTQIKEFMKDDSMYLTAQDCLKYGLVDEIVDETVLKKDNKKKSTISKKSSRSKKK